MCRVFQEMVCCVRGKPWYVVCHSCSLMCLNFLKNSKCYSEPFYPRNVRRHVRRGILVIYLVLYTVIWDRSHGKGQNGNTCEELPARQDRIWRSDQSTSRESSHLKYLSIILKTFFLWMDGWMDGLFT